MSTGFRCFVLSPFRFSNLRYPFSIFVLNVFEYYRVSFGQLHPQGVSRVLYFEVLCRTLGYDPTLLMFRRFFYWQKMVTGSRNISD
ncbi:hypothetical protein Hanom_Chr07g00622511 [Helianthus anomalus]